MLKISRGEVAISRGAEKISRGAVKSVGKRGAREKKLE